MSRIWITVALALGVGLSAACAQEVRRGSPPPPIEPRAPVVSVQFVMVEVTPDAAAKPGPEPVKGAVSLGTLDLSAPNEGILAELRKIGIGGHLELLYRMQIAGVDQQTASLQLGVSQPTISGYSMTQFGQANNIQYNNTGLRVEIQPRVAGETVSLSVNLSDSRFGRMEEGVPLSNAPAGQVIRVPSIQQVTLQTVVNVPSGQTIVLSGLTSEDGPRKRQLMILACPRILSGNLGESRRPGPVSVPRPEPRYSPPSPPAPSRPAP